MLALLPASALANSTTQIIVQREPGLTAAERRDIRADADVRLVETLSLPRTEVVAAEPGSVADALSDLNADPDVVYAERDRNRSTLGADPGLTQGRLWALRNTGQDVFGTGLYDADIDALEAWDQAVGGVNITGAGQTVAVVDSGVDVAHEDLAGKVPQSYDFIGPADAVAGGDDENGHGTHVAGTIAASRGNEKGIAGVAPGAEIMSLRVIDASGKAYDSDIAEAFKFAGQQGVPVVNASLGGPGASETLETAIELYPATLFVFSAGNGGEDGVGDDNADVPIWPCDAPLDNVICVGASTNRDARASFSNYGDRSVDLFAPGESILSTIPLGVVEDLETSKYAFFDGTSMASPHVAGTAALVLQAAPTLSSNALKDLILDAADRRSAFSGISVTGGRLNAGLVVARALAGAYEPADIDGDGVADAIDECPVDDGEAAAGGCPDADRDTFPDHLDGDRDGDGVPNADDRCPIDWNPTSTGCPAPPSEPAPTPPPPSHQMPPPAAPANQDGDGHPDSSDSCPTEYATTGNGCPLAQVASVSAMARKRSARIRVTANRFATMRITVERKKGRRWVRVARRTVSATRGTLRLSRLKRGTHRVRISISSSAGRGNSVSKTFRVR